MSVSTYWFYRYVGTGILDIPVYRYQNTVFTAMPVPKYGIYRYIGTRIPYLPLCMYRNTGYIGMSVPKYRIYRYVCTEIPYLPICWFRYTSFTDIYTVYTDIYRYIPIFIGIYLWYICNLLNLYGREWCICAVFARGQRVFYNIGDEGITVDAYPKAYAHSTKDSSYLPTSYRQIVFMRKS